MGEILSVATAVCWSVGSLFTHRALRPGIPSVYGVYVTVVVNTILLTLAVVIYAVLGLVPPLKPLGLVFFVLAGFCGPIMGRITQFRSMEYIGPSRMASFKAVSPLFTALIALLALGETFSLLSGLGIIVTVTGLLLLVRESQQVSRVESGEEAVESFSQNASDGEMGGAAVVANPSAGPPSPRQRFEPSRAFLGIAMGLLSASSFACAGVLRKAGLMHIDCSVLGAAIGSWVALISYTISFLSTRSMHTVIEMGRDALTLNVLGGFAMTWALFFTFTSLSLIQVSTAYAISSTEPLFTIFLSSLFHLGKREKITPHLVLAASVTVTGVVLITLG